jgi:predicted transposase/invertase (TIGR01784 family)
MQSELHPSFAQRILYYWARLHASQLSIGNCYEKLCPTVSIVFLNQSLLPTERIQSTFRISEVHDHYDLTDDLELHFIELPNLAAGQAQSPLERWMRFLLVRDEKELEELAMNDPDIHRAREALTALSRDPEAQELARQREMAQINLKLIRQFEREEGEAKGRVEGRVEGRRETLQLAIETAGELLGIEIDSARRQKLTELGIDELSTLLSQLRSERRWPGER